MELTFPWEKEDFIRQTKRGVKFLLSDHVSVDTWNGKKTAAVKNKGFVIGKVKTIDISNVLGGRQSVETIISPSPGCRIRGSASWLLPTSAKSIQKGDLIGLLQGALKPTIVRLQADHFSIIMIEAAPAKHIRTKNGDVGWSEFA
jgi:hypothetical protein